MLALVAGPPSPENELLPDPATVVMVPSGLMRRTRALPTSAMKRLPAVSAARPRGSLSRALAAGPPSPEKPAWPVPATVRIVPGAGGGEAAADGACVPG